MDPADLPLRDIHLPEPVLWWPPAPGWWIAVCTVLLVASVLLWRHYRHRSRYRRAIKRDLQRLSAAYAKAGDVPALVSGLSTLMRRAAITAEQRFDIASLSGVDWLAYLDEGLEGKPFSAGPGAILADGPYRSPDALNKFGNPGELLEICRRRLAGMPL